MKWIKTPRGRFRYQPVNIYFGFKRIDRDAAFENLKLLLRLLEKANIVVSPALGTLLGIIRENNFIEWDEDIDLFVLSEDKDKLLNCFWDLRDKGFDLVRVDRGGLLYSVMRNGEYIDFYIMEKLSPEIRGSGDIFMLERHLTDLIDWNFRGITIKVPKEYDEFLTLRYGEWRTPVQYFNFEMSKCQIAKMKMRNIVKDLIPQTLKLKLVRKYHRKSFENFLAQCEKNGIIFKYPIDY